MTRGFTLWFALVAMFLAYLVMLGWVETNGFVSADVTELWAKVLVLSDGPSAFRATDAIYPPLPFMMALAVQSGAGGLSTVPVPLLISAALAALMMVMWFNNLRENGQFTLWGALATTALLGLNPFFLRAVTDGPATVLAVIGTWVFARGIVNLRLTGNAPDMMKVAVGLLVAALSNSYGLLLCLGAMPFMIVAARPSLLVSSPVGYLMAMYFPVLVGCISVLFVSAVFDSRLLPLLSEGGAEVTSNETLTMALAVVPVVLVMIFRTVMAPRYFMPLIAAFGTVLSAFVLNVFLYVESDPVIAMAPMVAVAAVAARFWPPLHLREPICVVLLALWCILALGIMGRAPGAETRAWTRALAGFSVETVDLTQDVAAFLSDKSGIMIDVEQNPDLVTDLRHIDRLILAGEPGYERVMQGALPEADYLVVGLRTQGGQEADQLLLRFPDLRNSGVPGYREAYQNAEWRIFERADLGTD